MSDKPWEDAANSGSILPESFVRERLTTKLKLLVAFDRPFTTDFPSYETADVSYGYVVRISLCKSLKPVYIGRLVSIVRILEEYCSRYGSRHSRQFRFAMGDEGYDPDILCFSSHFENAKMLPDAAYMGSFGYREEAKKYQLAKPWIERIDKAYFRGTDSGVGRYIDRMLAPRVAAAILVVDLKNDFDFFLSGVEARSDQDESRRVYESLGILAERDPQDRILEYRYQIDIDGNSNAWSSLFLKLLTGSPVLKIMSDFNYRQWYYDKLNPWVNFVPIKSDLSDLVENLMRLKNDQTLAENIGKSGRELALSLDYDSQMTFASEILNKCSLN